MTVQIPITDYSSEQQKVWDCVQELWALSKDRDENKIRARLHPDYAGWDMSAPLPHNRDAAVGSVAGEIPALRDYELYPLSVQVYNDQVGVAHYVYSATVAAKGQPDVSVTGRWSEVYLRQDESWVLISVSGRPDAPAGT